MIRLNNMLDSGIDFRVSECKSDLIEFERKLTSAKAEFGKPFASAELIKEKRAPLKELDDELNLDANKEAEYEHNEEPDVPAPEKSRSLSDILSDAQRRSEEQAALHQGEYSRPELQY